MTTLNVTPSPSAPEQQTLNYQTPAAYSTTSVWAKGNRVFATDCAVFPPRCIRCNGNHRLEIRGQSLKYVPLYAYFVLILGLLPGALLLMCLQREVKVRLSICGHCRRKNLTSTLIGLAIVLAAFAALLAGAVYTKYFAFAGAALLLTAIVYAFAAFPRHSVSKIKNDIATIKGLGKPFIASLDQR